MGEVPAMKRQLDYIHQIGVDVMICRLHTPLFVYDDLVGVVVRKEYLA